MEDVEFEMWLKEVSPMELASLVESLFALDCSRHPVVREAILQLEEKEALERVGNYSDEEVFAKYIEFSELLGTPVNLTEYLAERREWEYESQCDCEELASWEEVEKAMDNHALELLAEYERKHGK